MKWEHLAIALGVFVALLLLQKLTYNGKHRKPCADCDDEALGLVTNDDGW
jgi:hypothetical protein